MVFKGHLHLRKVEIIWNQLYLTRNFLSWDTLWFQMKCGVSPSWSKQPLLVGTQSKVKTEYIWLREMLQFYSCCEEFHVGYLVQFSTKFDPHPLADSTSANTSVAHLWSRNGKIRKHRGLVYFLRQKKKNFFLKSLLKVIACSWAHLNSEMIFLPSETILPPTVPTHTPH